MISGHGICYAKRVQYIDYTPRPEVLRRLSSVHFVAVIGPTAVGKTTLMDRVIAADPSVHMVLTTTSRPPRPGEQNGIDYHFRTKTAMQQQIAAGEFVQVAPSVLGDLYATLPEEYATTGIAVMAVIADALPSVALLQSSCKSVWRKHGRRYSMPPLVICAGLC